MQPFLCWFLLGIRPEVVLNSYDTSGLVLRRLPISGRTSGFSSRAPDMFPDEFPQFRISCPDFPTLFPEVHWALSLELPYLRSSTELRWMSSGLHSEIRGTYSGKGHSARAEAKPFLPNPTLRMVSNTVSCDEFTVIDAHDIHNIAVDFCGCKTVQICYKQLLQVQ